MIGRTNAAAFSGGSGQMDASKISFTGSMLFDTDGTTWECALLSSGSLSFAVNPGNCEIFVVDGGDGGGTANSSGVYIYSGDGGDGGKHKNHASVQLQRNTAYTAVIGIGGDDNAAGGISSFSGGGLSLDASNGTRSTGGTRAQMTQGITSAGTVPTGGANGVYAYEEASDTTLIASLAGILFGPSGGAGQANNDQYVWTDQHGGVNTGGQTGGGDGGDRDSHAGKNATGYGAGAGGGYADGASGSYGLGGFGSDGIILIRGTQPN